VRVYRRRTARVRHRLTARETGFSISTQRKAAIPLHVYVAWMRKKRRRTAHVRPRPPLPDKTLVWLRMQPVQHAVQQVEPNALVCRLDAHDATPHRHTARICYRLTNDGLALMNATSAAQQT